MDFEYISDTLEFKSLEDEEYRVYIFSKNESVRIENPVALHVSGSGGHRVFDKSGVSHYIPNKWIHLYWEVKHGEKPFKF